MAFPSLPTNGQTYERFSRDFEYNASKQRWEPIASFLASPATVPDYVNVWMIAGGGGGAGLSGIHGNGGGGAGGLVDSTFAVASGRTYSISIGAGGSSTSMGGDSIFQDTGLENLTARLVAYGGGTGTPGADVIGGCGGGGYRGIRSGAGGIGVTNQGYPGGVASGTQYNSQNCAAGGGGVGGPGVDRIPQAAIGSIGGPGTDAYTSLLSIVEEGALVSGSRYVGTGGDSSNNSGNAYTSGTGGGYNGITNQYGAGTGAGCINRVVQNGGNAQAFTGSGGGGGGGSANGMTGGSGGSGLVIVYYSTIYNTATAGTSTYYTDGSYHYYKFNVSGTLTFD